MININIPTETTSQVMTVKRLSEEKTSLQQGVASLFGNEIRDRHAMVQRLKKLWAFSNVRPRSGPSYPAKIGER